MLSPWPLNCNNCPETIEQLYQQLKVAGVTVIRIGDQLEFVLSVDRFFRQKSNTRLYPNQIETMKLITRLLRAYGNVPVKVYGHTDEVGSDQSKLRRSKQQADTIAAYLWSNGIPLGNIEAIGCGDTEPVSSNETVDGSATNRRIEIITS